MRAGTTHHVQTNSLYQVHAAAGARLLPSEEPDPLLTYGDVPAEYAAAQEAAALFDETDRELVVARGEEAARRRNRVHLDVRDGKQPRAA